jgi:hypothetical protein
MWLESMAKMPAASGEAQLVPPTTSSEEVPELSS